MNTVTHPTNAEIRKAVKILQKVNEYNAHCAVSEAWWKSPEGKRARREYATLRKAERILIANY